jgi:hypothetical protein
MNTTPLIAGWKCSCGQMFDDAHQAFLHRDGTDFHQVSPSVSRMTGIEKQSLQTEIQQAAKGGKSWQPQ